MLPPSEGETDSGLRRAENSARVCLPNGVDSRNSRSADQGPPKQVVNRGEEYLITETSVDSPGSVDTSAENCRRGHAVSFDHIQLNISFAGFRTIIVILITWIRRITRPIPGVRGVASDQGSILIAAAKSVIHRAIYDISSLGWVSKRDQYKISTDKQSPVYYFKNGHRKFSQNQTITKNTTSCRTC